MNQSPGKQTGGLVNFFKIAPLTPALDMSCPTDLDKMNWVLFLKEYLFIFQKAFYHRCYGGTVLDYTSFKRHVMIFSYIFQCFVDTNF